MTSQHHTEHHQSWTYRSILRGLTSKSVLLALVLVVTIIAVWWFAAYARPQSAKDLEAAKSSVGRHMLLPTNEEPTFATVTDKSKLKSKFLASKANNGDFVLVYTQNQIVIVYRPSIDKIVAVSGVTADSALAESQKATITVLDGANNPEKTKKIIELLKTTYPDMDITDGGASNKRDFKTTIVIDNSGEKDYLADALAKLTGGARGIVPISEAKAGTNLMLIVGSNGK